MSTAEDMFARMCELMDAMPSQIPTLIRVGDGVVLELNSGRTVTHPLIEPPLPPGMDIIEDPD